MAADLKSPDQKVPQQTLSSKQHADHQKRKGKRDEEIRFRSQRLSLDEIGQGLQAYEKPSWWLQAAQRIKPESKF